MKYIRIIFAFSILPAAAGFVWSFTNLLAKLGGNGSVEIAPFWFGLGGYFVFQIIFFKPIRTYVFGHEVTHAIAGVLSGARLKSFRVSSTGGSVILTKSNLWIALAPYFVPIYTILFTIVYWISGKYFGWGDRFYAYFIFVVGFTLSFHFALTHFALIQGQSDLKKYGSFFSSVTIVLTNCLMLAVLLKFIFPDLIGLKHFFYDGIIKTKVIVIFLIQMFEKLIADFR